jgi:sulfatase modifying factor 1
MTLAVGCGGSNDEPTPPRAAEVTKGGAAEIRDDRQSPTSRGPARSSAARAPPSSGSPGRCPAGTLEVTGLYCTDLLHQCIQGGKNYVFEPTDVPEPYYCDAFRVGYARCLGREKPMHFCIDEYEYPNRKGALPMVMVSWYEARRLCQERVERLCDDDEWTLACEGPERLPYTYGWRRDPGACNIDKPWIRPDDGILANHHAPPELIEREVERLSKRVPSGSMPRCRSPYGVMDMGGNVDEWAANVTLHGKPYKSLFKGGHWMHGARNRCRPVTTSHDETIAYYAEGFRCCADPER